MTLEQLRIFVAVADRQHVTRAASRPAPDAVGGERGDRRAGAALRHQAVRPHRPRHRADPAPGSEFLREARAVLARADAAVQVLNDLAGLKRGALALAASQTVANYWLPPRLQAFRAAYPEIALQARHRQYRAGGAGGARRPRRSRHRRRRGRRSGAGDAADRRRPAGDRGRSAPSVGAPEQDRAEPAEIERLGAARAGLRHPRDVRTRRCARPGSS